MKLEERRNWVEVLAPKVGSRRFGKVAFLALAILGVEIPRSVRIGTNLRLPHGAVGLVIHPDTVIGDDVMIFGGVTLGRGDQYLLRGEIPPGGGITVGSSAIIGAGAKVLFKSGERLIVGDGAVIGANSVVLRSVPAGEIWAGAPARKVGVNRLFGL